MPELNPGFPATLRDRQQVADMFAGLDLVSPGVVQISKWRPDSGSGAQAAAALWGGVARKPGDLGAEPYAFLAVISVLALVSAPKS